MEAKNQKDLLTYFALFIIACLLFILAAGNVLADDLAPDTVYYSDIKGLYSATFYESDNHCTIGSRSNSGLSGAVFIPAKIIVRDGDGVISVQQGDPPKTYNVTEIGRFYGNKYITSLTISEGIQKISDEAFMNCTGLTGDLTIPESVTTIGSSAFYGCSGFTGTLEIPSEVTVINSSSFKNCSGLTGLKLPPALTTINSSAFEGCTGMTGTLNLPDTLTTVDNSAFYQCGFTGSLTLPEGLTYLGGASFGCPEISGILTIPSSVTSVFQSPDECDILCEDESPERGPWVQNGSGRKVKKEKQGGRNK